MFIHPRAFECKFSALNYSATFLIGYLFIYLVFGGQIAENFTRVGARHGECKMRGRDSPLTINAINVNGGDFGGHFSSMKGDMKIWGRSSTT